jgi:hypothetical protein
MKSPVFVLSVVVSGMLIFPGCSPYGASDQANIRSNYVAFRVALIKHETEKARTLMSDYIQDWDPQRIYSYFDDVVKTNFALTSDSYIMFDRARGRTNRAWLWPSSGAKVGTAGFGFTKETNGWRINQEFMPVMH